MEETLRIKLSENQRDISVQINTTFWLVRWFTSDLHQPRHQEHGLLMTRSCFWFLLFSHVYDLIPISWPYGLEVIQNLQIIPVKREYNHNSLLRTNHMVNVVAPALHQPFILHCSSLQCSLQHCSAQSCAKNQGREYLVWVQLAAAAWPHLDEDRY